MPLYRCTVAAGLSGLEQRSRVAKEVTRIHCEITGAPPAFVHNFWTEAGEGELPAGRRAVLLGSIRSGRTPEQKRELVSRMTRSLAGTLGIGEDEALVAVVDVPASWVMEGGAVLPEPGEEAGWLANHA